MQVELRYQPYYALAMVALDEGETIQTEGSAMVGMSPRPGIADSRFGRFIQITGMI